MKSYLMIAFLAFCAGGVAAVYTLAPLEQEETGYTQAERQGMIHLVKVSSVDSAVAFKLAKPAHITEAERAKALEYLFGKDQEK